MYAAAPSIDLNITSIYPPHFFLRYRERILKNRSISNEEVIRDYFTKDWGFMATVINDAYESVYHSFEEHSKNETISFVAATNLGFCFGEKCGAVNIIKTILSEDMLYENQKVLFIDLRKQFTIQNNERYGVSPF